MKFPSHLNCDGKIVSEMGPSTSLEAHTRFTLPCVLIISGLTEADFIYIICRVVLHRAYGTIALMPL